MKDKTMVDDDDDVPPERSADAPQQRPANGVWKQSHKMNKEEREALKVRGMTAICVVGAYAPVPLTAGSAATARPVMLVTNSSWHDALSSTVDRYSPTFSQGLLTRVWFKSADEAKRLMVELPKLLATMSRAMRGEWHDLEIAYGVDYLHLAIEEAATHLGFETFSDEQVLALVRKDIKDASGAPF